MTLIASAFLAIPAIADDEPKYGGTLTYMIPADAPPSFDGHRESTYATVHSVAPFYSVLIRVNPENPADITHFVCDLCTELPQPTDDGKTYAFKIRQDVKFHDGSPLTAADVAASYNKIIFPPNGQLSARSSNYLMVDKVEAPDPATVVFHLKFPTSAFLPALADPFNFIYKKEILDKDPRWYEKNILGSGPFKFVDYQVGQSIKGEKNTEYYLRGRPYLDGFTGIYADKQAVRVEAIRADRAAIEFRSWPIGRVHGYPLWDYDIEALGELLGEMEADKRRAVPGIGSDRADVVLAGIVVFQEVLRAAKADHIVVSGTGIREGIALEAVVHHLFETSRYSHGLPPSFAIRPKLLGFLDIVVLPLLRAAGQENHERFPVASEINPYPGPQLMRYSCTPAPTPLMFETLPRLSRAMPIVTFAAACRSR